MKNFISHPLVQVLSFSIILINGKEWGALPYGWYVIFASADWQLFGIIGIIAVLFAITSMFYKRNALQPLSLLLMWCSLITFFWQLSEPKTVFKGGAALVTALIFLTVTVMVLHARLAWKKS